jgi:hypothetical protein
VATGEAQELERARPFGVLADAFGCAASSPDPRRRAIATLLATSAGDRGPVTVTSDPGLQFQAVDAFVDLAESLALARPLVVGVDDLQWADPSSLLTLGAMGGRLDGVPVALVACLRPSPRAAELERALQALDRAGARRLVLGGLDDRAVAEVVAAEPGQRLLAEVAGAGGNPLFVTELVAALFEEGAIRVAGGCAEVAEMSLPPTLRLTILRRLSFLPDDTLQALRAASVLGSSFPSPSWPRPPAAPPWSCRRPWPRRSGPGCWRTTAAACASATTCSARPSTRTCRPACGWPCTTRPASGWPARARPPWRWPSTWPAAPSRATPTPWPG